MKQRYKFALVIVIIELYLVVFMDCTSFAQAADGKYKYIGDGVTVNFTVTDVGWTISNFVLVKKSTQETIKGGGEWFKVNKHGADQDYDGPDGWYQIQTRVCNYELDVRTNTMILTEYDCSNSTKNKVYRLTRQR